jgi:hypothetical protein
MMKSNRDKESPCLTPRKCLIGGPWWPLSKILEEAVLRRVSIHLCHVSLNPCGYKTSIRKGHKSVSKALDMSSFRSSMGIFFFLIKKYLYNKLFKCRWNLNKTLNESSLMILVFYVSDPHLTGCFLATICPS